MARLQRLISWYWQAKTAFSVHSPLVYHFCESVLDDHRWYYAFESIEVERSRLRQDTTLIQNTGYGAGSRVKIADENEVRTILQASSSQPWKGRLLFRICKWWQPDTIIEFGTSLGISSAYLASARQSATMYTVDGNAAGLSIAQSLWHAIQLTNIHSIHARFQDAWQQIPDLNKKRVLIFLDGDHQSEHVGQMLAEIAQHCTKPYLVIIDDIRWSADMENGWHRWSTSYGGAWLDLFQAGIWISDEAFLEPIKMNLIPRRFKPIRLGWI
jgi:predicted O-methyltransferase YrrM